MLSPKLPGGIVFEIESRPAKVHVELSAEDWELFADMKGAKNVAKALNKAAEKALTMNTLEDASNSFEKVAITFEEYGAYDTEPRSVFYGLAEQVYGPPEAQRYFG